MSLLSNNIHKMKKTGYRDMLRDRCPKLVNYALRWCKVKDVWLDHVYKNWIWLYSSNEERLKATKLILGISKYGMKFKFEDTIAWDNLTDSERDMWNNVSRWVSWFTISYSYVQNDYEISKKAGKDLAEIKLDIMKKYLSAMCPTKSDDAATKERKAKNLNKFVDFLIDCFENKV